MKTEVRLPVDVYSPEHLSLLVVELHEYITNLQHQAIRAKAAAKTKAVAEPETVVSPALTTLLTGMGLTNPTPAALEALHKQLKATLASAPVMHITLPAIPGRTLKRQLTVWFRTQVHPTSLLTFSARSDMGGGIMLQAGSHFYDYSFRARVLANPKRIGELAGV